MSATDSLISLLFSLQGEAIREEIEKAINAEIKTMADKYATYFDVKWKVYCNNNNNPQSVIDQRKIVIDAYIQVPAFMSDFVHISSEVKFDTVPTLPGKK